MEYEHPRNSPSAIYTFITTALHRPVNLVFGGCTMMMLGSLVLMILGAALGVYKSHEIQHTEVGSGLLESGQATLMLKSVLVSPFPFSPLINTSTSGTLLCGEKKTN